MFAYDLATEETMDIRDEMSRRRFDKKYGFNKRFTLEHIPANEYGARFFATEGTSAKGVVTAPNQVILALTVAGAIEAIEEASAEV